MIVICWTCQGKGEIIYGSDTETGRERIVCPACKGLKFFSTTPTDGLKTGVKDG
jgi:DnaJ-class molecular chaperone